jgi:aminopeptidase-like protein
MTAAGEQPTTSTGDAMYALVERLYPLCRSITGDGVRATLEIVGEYVPLQVHEVPTGTQVLDWTVPQEWNIRDAYIADTAGRRVVDFAASSLHVLGYSVPVSATMPLAELRGHLHTLPEHPSWVPYRTSYYKPDWGFCLAQETLDALPDGEYEVCVDSTLADGHLTYAEHVVPGQVPDEVVVSCHVCHPSLANDNLAGIAVAVFLARALAEQTPYYTYRFIFAPGTIGAITWLARNAERIDRVKHGLVLACAGDPGQLTYKQSRRGDAEIDRVMRHVLAASERPYHVNEFTPYGYDERQFCSPGFDLGVGSLTRTPYAGYPEYHTSADNLSYVTPAELADSYSAIIDVIDVIEQDGPFRNLSPYGEPQLGKRGVYPTVGGKSASDAVMAMLWTLAYSDGNASLLDIAATADLDFADIRAAAATLQEAGLLERL